MSLGPAPLDFEVELDVLREEVDSLRSEVRDLKREVRVIKGYLGSAGGGNYPSASESQDSRDSRLSVPSVGTTSLPSPSVSPVPQRGVGPAPLPTAGQSVHEASRTSPSPSTLSWIEREEICDGIGAFLTRCIEGTNRGPSGRDRLLQASRFWIVVRDFNGLIYTPPRVFKTWTSCKNLVKPGGRQDPGDSIYVGLPSEREARRVIRAAQLEWPEVVEQ